MTGEIYPPTDCDARFKQIWHTIEGNGQPGLRQDVEDLKVQLAEINAIEKERQRNHKENKDRSNIVIAMLTALLLLAGLILKHL